MNLEVLLFARDYLQLVARYLTLRDLVTLTCLSRRWYNEWITADGNAALYRVCDMEGRITQRLGINKSPRNRLVVAREWARQSWIVEDWKTPRAMHCMYGGCGGAYVVIPKHGSSFWRCDSLYACCAQCSEGLEGYKERCTRVDIWYSNHGYVIKDSPEWDDIVVRALVKQGLPALSDSLSDRYARSIEGLRINSRCPCKTHLLRDRVLAMFARLSAEYAAECEAHMQQQRQWCKAQ